VVPAGAIVMWSGTLASVPSGWALCDGSNGTPDLRDKFIKGWASGVNPGGTGGAATHDHGVGTYAVNAHTTDTSLTGAQSRLSGPATHTISGRSESVNHEPPYYKLAFIMKVGSYGAEGGSFLDLYSRGDIG